MAQLVSKANALIVAGFVLAFAVSALLYVRYDADVLAAQSWVDHTYNVKLHISDILVALDEAEGGQRGYLLTGRDTYLAPYNAARDRSALLFGELKSLTVDNADEQQRLTKLSALMQQKLELIAKSIEAGKEGNGAALTSLGQGRDVMHDIRALLAAMTATEDALLKQRDIDVARVRSRTVILVSAGAIAALLLLAIGGMMVRRAARDRGRAEQAVRDAASQLRVSFDSLSQGIAVFDNELTLINWNQCFISLLDLPIALVRRGTSYTAIAEALAADGTFFETTAQIADALRNHVSLSTPIVFRRTRADDRTFELRRTMLPAGGFAITVSDITTQVRIEEHQRNSQRMRALGELTGGVAHDFNNLLTVIAGNLDLLQNKKTLDGEAQRYVDGALRGVSRGTSLTQHLLAFGRRQPLAPVAVDLNRLVGEMTSGMLRRSLGERIDIKLVENAGLWPAYADPAQIENALLNLAINARDAMPQGGKLTIETANVTLDERYAEQNAEVTAGQYVMIAVSDTGEGMTAEIVARAFEPFFTTKDEGKGSGLGLAMVHGFAKQSKGHVKIYSEPGNGTSVKLYLPRSHRPVTEESEPPTHLPRGNATVLVVEDDIDVRRVAVAQLTDLGYSVRDAADAEAGLKIFTETGDIDLLLTDVVLPGRLRGRDLADLVRRASPATKILFMSGYTENAIVHDGKLDEGTMLLSKPFRREDLAKKVAQALNHPEPRATDNVIRMKPN